MHTHFPVCTQYSGIFAECSLSVAMFRASGEHLGNILEENTFKKILNGKVVFVLKVYDLMMTNNDLLVNSSNHKAMFPEYLKNIPRISVSKIFQGYFRNIAKLWKYFYEVKKFKKLFCELSCENFRIVTLLSRNVFLNYIETVFQLMFWKDSYRCWTAGKNLRLAQLLQL